jgi:mono/diheme cytochrome c family protein
MRSTIRPLLLIISLAALTGCRGWDSDKPPVHPIRNMFTQEKGKPYREDTSGLFADTRVMRAPVEGTVSLEHLDADDVLQTGQDPDGKPALKFPTAINVDDALAARGEQRYRIYCTPCHGVNGDGKGRVSVEKGLFVPPANFLDARLKGMRHGQIYQAMLKGVNNNNMPSYATQIPVEDRWAIVAYIRKLQGVTGDPNGAAMEVPKAAVASAEVGAKLYEAKTCVTCHSLDGSKKVGPTWKGLYGSMVQTDKGEVKADDAYLRESIVQPMAKIVTGFPPAMPTVELSEIEVQSLILYMKSLK